MDTHSNCASAPAFPVALRGPDDLPFGGLTKREYIAISALTGVLARTALLPDSAAGREYIANEAAALAACAADALLLALGGDPAQEVAA